MDRHLRQRGEHHLLRGDRAHRRHRLHVPGPGGECRRLRRRVRGRARDPRRCGASGAAAPAAPQRLISGGQDGIALLFWGAADDNGSPITGYQYRQKEGAGDFGAWTDIIDSAPGGENALSFTVTGLTNGTVYTFEVRAVNNVGPGAETEGSNVVPQSVPLAPTGFSATRGDERAILSWTAANNNGSPITKYQYNRKESGGAFTG